MDSERLSKTFVELADTLVADFDVLDFLHMLTARCTELLDVTAAGVLLADPAGDLRVMAASSERVRLLELFQLQNDQGPCLDCYHSGQTVSVSDLSAVEGRWPRFSTQARQHGYGAVLALPMRLRQHTIGALNPVQRRAHSHLRRHSGRSGSGGRRHRRPAATARPTRGRYGRDAVADRAEQPSLDRTSQRHPGRAARSPDG